MTCLCDLEKYKWETIHGFQVNLKYFENTLSITIQDGDEVVLDLSFFLFSGPTAGNFIFRSPVGEGDLIARVSHRKIAIIDPAKPYEKIDIYPIDNDE
jgi:hypothetical protein